MLSDNLEAMFNPPSLFPFAVSRLSFPVSCLLSPIPHAVARKNNCLYLYRIKPLSLLIPVLIGITLNRLVAHIHVGYFITTRNVLWIPGLLNGKRQTVNT